MLQRKLQAVLAVDVSGYSDQMARDEAGTFARLKAFHADQFRPQVKRHKGRVFKVMGDGALVAFPSVHDAVACANALQLDLDGQQPGEGAAERLRLRMGIGLGDVIVDGGDLYGHGVNVAARMETLAEPGTICIAGNAAEHLNARDLPGLVRIGPCQIRNMSEPIEVFQIRPGGVSPAAPSAPDDIAQDIGFCTTPDGVQIARATVGAGPAVVSVSNWLTHLELDLAIPMRRALVRALSPRHQVIRYDARGSGLSDRQVADFSLEASITDLKTVIDASGHETVSLIGQSQGAAIAAAFAARYPERVTRLVLCGGYARGRRMRGSAGEVAESDAFITMIREGWGKELDAYVRMFGAFFMPDATAEQLSRFTDLQRKATPPENAARIQLAIDSIDITDELSRVVAPTLVFHVREDARAPFEEGRRLAAGIPNARFIPLEGRNHVMLADDPSLARFCGEVAAFLG